MKYTELAIKFLKYYLVLVFNVTIDNVDILRLYIKKKKNTSQLIK